MERGESGFPPDWRSERSKGPRVAARCYNPAVSAQQVRWPRVKEILEGVMARWERREGRKGLPGIHDYYWESPEHLAGDTSMGRRFIEPGVAGEDTYLVQALRRGLGTIPRMPMGGPFLSEEEIGEIARWIDDGMPE